MEKKREKRTLKMPVMSKMSMMIVGSVVGVLLIIYLGAALYFMNHFFFRTTINGMDVSGKSAKKVQEKTNAGVESYQLEIEPKMGTTFVISGPEISMSENWEEGLAKLIKKQNGLAWIAHLFFPQELDLEGIVDYDKEKLQEILSQQDMFDKENQVEATPAGIGDYGSDGFTVIPEVEGSVIDSQKLLGVVDDALMELREKLELAGTEAYVQPTVRAEDEEFLQAVDSMNTYAGTVITYEVGEVLDASTISTWLSLGDDLTVKVDESLVEEYISSLAKKYNTCYKNKQLKTSYDGQIVEITNVHYGWKIDNETEKAAILSEIKEGKPASRELNYSMTANSHGEKDYGDSYVEINLTAQHLFLYEDGELVVESDFVSGLPKGDRKTPTGAFSLTYKQKDATLKGTGYSTHVDYWMPFYGNYGMHDASWRDEFGGAIYKTRGSHGCVNLPIPVAEKIFEVVEKDFPVLIYELPGTEPDTSKQDGEAVRDKIAEAVGTDPEALTLEQEAGIAEARKAYDQLEPSAKAFVDNYELLTQAEAKLAVLKAEQTPGGITQTTETE